KAALASLTAAIAGATAIAAHYLKDAQAGTLVAGAAAWLGVVRWLPRTLSLENTVGSMTRGFGTHELDSVMAKVRGELQDVVKRYFVEHDPELRDQVRAGKIKVVVFIDELDRCPLNRIVDILEAIKLFLAEEIFIVLLAVDTRVAA